MPLIPHFFMWEPPGALPSTMALAELTPPTALEPLTSNLTSDAPFRGKKL